MRPSLAPIPAAASARYAPAHERTWLGSCLCLQDARNLPLPTDGTNAPRVLWFQRRVNRTRDSGIEWGSNMVVATLRALTWGTLAAAVVSAVLLTAGGEGMLRAESSDGAQVSRSKTMSAGGNGAAQATPARPAARSGSQH